MAYLHPKSNFKYKYPDSQTISVQPWEKDKLQDIEKAIIDSNLGFNP